MPLILIFDGNSIMHRAYHAIPPLTSPKGELVNSVYGFFSIWLAVVKRFLPDSTAVAFDTKGPTFRDKLFKEYKAKRVKPPDNFYQQIPIIKQLLKDIEVPMLEKTGFEADDLIGTLAKKLARGGWQIIIVTGDQDTFQLIDDQIKVFYPTKGLSNGDLFGEQEVQSKFGFMPERMVDFKALAGDPSDNIPGVAGIGKKTAQTLVCRYANLDAIYQDMVNLPSRTQALLSAGKSQAELSRQLACIDTNAPIVFSQEDSKLKNFNQEKVEQEFIRLGFKSLINRLPQSERKNLEQQALL